MFGKVKLCNICTFIDDAQRDRERGLATFWIEILEKCKVAEATSERAQKSLVEIKSSRSKDLIIRQSETLHIQLDGQVRVVGSPLTEKYTLTYLENTDNHLLVPLEIKKDQDKPPNAAFIFKDNTSGSACHTVAVSIRDLTELNSGKTVFCTMLLICVYCRFPKKTKIQSDADNLGTMVYKNNGTNGCYNWW